MDNLTQAIGLEAQFQLQQHAGGESMYFSTRYQWFQVARQGIPFSQARLNPYNSSSLRFEIGHHFKR